MDYRFVYTHVILALRFLLLLFLFLLHPYILVAAFEQQNHVCTSSFKIPDVYFPGS